MPFEASGGMFKSMEQTRTDCLFKRTEVRATIKGKLFEGHNLHGSLHNTHALWDTVKDRLKQTSSLVQSTGYRLTFFEADFNPADMHIIQVPNLMTSVSTTN